MIFAFPISDDNSEAHSQHYKYAVHYAIILICIAVIGYELYLQFTQGAPGRDAFIQRWSYDPKEYIGADYMQHSLGQRARELFGSFGALNNKALLRMMAHVFLQGGLLRLIFNMIVLWMLGDNVQYAMGQLRYAVFFLLTGLLAGIGAALFSADAAFIGNASANGAIMAVAAAYMFYFPAAKINVFYMIVPFWIGVTSFAARTIIGIYVLLQLGLAWFLADMAGGAAIASINTYIFSLFLGLALAWPFRKNHAELLRQPVARESYRKTIKEYVKERHDDHWGHGH